MKKKELKNLAKRIAKQEMIIQSSSDKAEIKEAQNQILNLSKQAIDFEDLCLLDEYIMEILSKENINS